jgi:hypothetical protein
MKNKSRNSLYDEQEGVFTLEDEISVNWLVSQVLQQKDAKITKLSNEDLQKLLTMLSQSELRMPDGQYCLFWMKAKIKEKKEMAESRLGENWSKVSSRFRYILEQIDQSIIGIDNLKEKMLIIREEIKKKTHDKNNMESHFEPL